jgi:D-glycero-D-manno-heptose 1,7-bisphosphate phosphatase
LNEEVGYIRELEKLVLIKGAADAIRKLNDAGIAAVLVTNQSGAARGYYPETHIRDLNARLVRLLKESGATMDAVYYCPHMPEPEGTVAPYAGQCDCRKPATGLVEQAYQQHPDFDRQRSYVVGDKATDVELAHNCGAKGVLVETGYGQRVLDGTYQWKVTPDHTADDIVSAIEWILQDLKIAV